MASDAAELGVQCIGLVGIGAAVGNSTLSATLHSQMMERPELPNHHIVLDLNRQQSWNSVVVYEALWRGMLTNPSFLSPVLDDAKINNDDVFRDDLFRLLGNERGFVGLHCMICT